MNTTSTNAQSSSAVAQDVGLSLWQQLKRKRICYFALPLIVMATITEFVILATGWKYQQLACLPKGMGVTFFSIGPIGATILAVELLKLPLAIWTASRQGWHARQERDRLPAGPAARDNEFEDQPCRRDNPEITHPAHPSPNLGTTVGPATRAVKG